MKAHIGVDSKTKLIHSMVATPANAHDSTMLEDLLHGDETRVWGDQAYRGQREVIRRCAPRAKDFTNQRCKFKGVVDEAKKAKNARKSKVRAKVEHCFAVMKRVFGFTKVRYRGINKNAGWLFTTCALVNLFMARPAERARRYVKQAPYAAPTTRLSQKQSAIASLFKESLIMPLYAWHFIAKKWQAGEGLRSTK